MRLNFAGIPWRENRRNRRRAANDPARPSWRLLRYETLEDRRLLDGGGTPRILFVDRDAPGMHDGSSWHDAFLHLQDALSDASSGDEIRVAQGIYTPADPNGSREATFQIVAGVTVNGGYAGWGETNPDARDALVFPTVLSGDLNGNDGPNFANNQENSYHVVTGSGTCEPSLIDGFTVTGGNADGTLRNAQGGGMYINSNTAVTRCTVAGNWAVAGAGMYCGPTPDAVTRPSLTDVTFRGNLADQDGGGLWIGDSDVLLTNCIISGNHAGGSGGGLLFGNDNVSKLAGCLVVGNTAGGNGGGISTVFSFDWELTNCTLAGNTAGGHGGGMYHGFDSHAAITNSIFWGNGPEEIYVDGSQAPAVNFSCVQGWDGSLEGTGNTGADPRFIDADGLDGIFGTPDDNLRLGPGSSALNGGDNEAVPSRLVTDVDGNPRMVGGVVDKGAYERRGPRVIYVDRDATGASNGSSWASAFHSLQDALTTAEDGDEIHVAAGTYKPDQGAGQVLGDRSTTFQVGNGVTLRGGYAGFGAANPDERDIFLHSTILSGDLAGDDGPNWANRGDNAWHVVSGSGFLAEAALEGLVIASGNADGVWSYPASFGGGLYMFRGTVSQCSIRDNTAADGGGVFQSNADFVQCVIANNLAFRRGGGASFDGMSATFTACIFSGNVAQLDGPDSRGGAIFTLDNSAPDLINCVFAGNRARTGGALYAMENYGSEIVNCVFAGNQASEQGAALYNDGPGTAGSPLLSNCIFWGNSVAGATDEAAQIAGDTPTINYSCIQGLTGGLGGTGNLGGDPRFIDADGPDNILGTADDDFRLQPGSPCINAGHNASIPPGIHKDLDGNPRIVHLVVDIGAYEFASWTSYWDGGGTDNKWSTAANWIGDVAPLSGDNLVFPNAALQMESADDYPAGTKFGEIRYTGGAATVTTSINAATVNVQAGQLTAGSIVADTLVIGAGGSVVIASSIPDSGATLLATTSTPAQTAVNSLPVLISATPLAAVAVPLPIASISMPANSTTAFVGPWPAVVPKAAATDAALAQAIPALPLATAVPPVVPFTQKVAAKATIPATTAASVTTNASFDRLALLFAMERSATELSTQRHLRALDAALAERVSFLADWPDAIAPAKPARRRMEL
jgi:hypothetical protein